MDDGSKAVLSAVCTEVFQYYYTVAQEKAQV